MTSAIAAVGCRSAEALALRVPGVRPAEAHARPEPGLRATASAFPAPGDRIVKNGRLKQSVSRWPYQKIPLPEFCHAVADMGLTAIDLLEEADWGSPVSTA